MSYRLNKTNGDLLTDLVDGQLDTTSTDLTLVGRNYKGFGEFLNENYIKLLENFSSTSAPNNPIAGQLWFDTSENRLKLYDGSSFKSAGGPIVSSSQPTNPTAGDLWIDDLNNQLYFWDGQQFQLAGPEYTSGQGKTGFETQTVIDTVSAEKTILKMFVAGILQGVFADSTFKVDFNRAVPGYPQDPNDTANPKRQLFKKGFNPVSASDFLYNGTAQNSRALTNESGVSFTEANFMRTDTNTSTTGSVKIKNSAGLSLGIGDTEYGILKIDPATLQTIIETQQNNRDINIRIRAGNQFTSAIFVDSSEEKIGIFNNGPTETLDVVGTARVSGNFTIGGNLTVNGATTTVNATTIELEDKNIVLASSEGAAIGDDVTLENGGITLKSTDYDKTILYKNAYDAFTSNINFNLVTSGDVPDPAYMIGNNNVLTASTLATSVTSALGLTQIGTLTSLDVDNTNINGTTITTTGTGLNIISADTITVNSNLITGVATPISEKVSAAGGGTEDIDSAVATKGYVDAEIDNNNVAFNLDITGLADPQLPGVNDGPINSVRDILESMYPANTKNGSTAVIHCTSYSGITVTIAQADLTSVIDKSYLSVMTEDSSAGSVLQDIAISGDLVANTTLTPNRYTMTFTSNGTVWSHGTTNIYT